MENGSGLSVQGRKRGGKGLAKASSGSSVSSPAPKKQTAPVPSGKQPEQGGAPVVSQSSPPFLLFCW